MTDFRARTYPSDSELPMPGPGFDRNTWELLKETTTAAFNDDEEAFRAHQVFIIDRFVNDRSLIQYSAQAVLTYTVYLVGGNSGLSHESVAALVTPANQARYNRSEIEPEYFLSTLLCCCRLRKLVYQGEFYSRRFLFSTMYALVALSADLGNVFQLVEPSVIDNCDRASELMSILRRGDNTALQKYKQEYARRLQG